MAMYYYARKLQKSAKVSAPLSSSSSSSSSYLPAKQKQIPPPPPLIMKGNSKVSGKSPANFLMNGDVLHYEQRSLPPCCAMLTRSDSRYENYYEDDDERGEEKNGEVDYKHPLHKGPHLIHNSKKEDTRNSKEEDETDEELYAGIHHTYYNGPDAVPKKPHDNLLPSPHTNGKQMKSVEFKGSQLISGTWEALIQLLLPTETHFPDQDFVFAFLLCCRLYNPPHLTLSSIFHHFSNYNTKTSSSSTNTPSPLHRNSSSTCINTNDPDQDEDEDEDVSPEEQQDFHHPEELQEEGAASALNENEGELEEDKARAIEDEELNLEEDRVHLLVKFVKLWTELLPHDFRDDRVMHFVRIIARVCVNINSEVREEVSQLLANLLSKLTTLEAYERNLGRIRMEASIGEPIAAPSVVTICPNPSIMAQQLTLVELERFSYIGAQEFVAQLLVKDRHRRGSHPEESGACDTQNLDAFIAWFKRLSMFVASEICKVGRECFMIRNFNSLMGILSGLSCSPVARLKRTWGKICCADLIELQTAMDPKNNFSAYRTMYKASVWQAGRLHESHNYKIIVPYFSLLLRDVYNLNSAYPSVLPSNGHINLEKFNHLAKLIKEIVSWQSVNCHFTKVQSVFNAVQALPIFNEPELITASYGCEDPENLKEKEHLNRIRRDHRTVPLVACSSSAERLYHV